jgi:hypothetical protein|tara:strand:- start:64 stop:237 length:174 start_codon:yes stop_codon:yes gene_type:complete
MDNLEDYNINFQEILDKMTLQDLKRFKESLGKYFDRRLAKEIAELEEARKSLNLLSN